MPKTLVSSDWTSGQLIFSQDAVGGVIKLGTESATQADGKGFSLYAAGSNRTYAFEVNADTGSVDLTGDTYVAAIRGLTNIGTTQTNASIMGILGTLQVKTAVDISANYFAVRGHLDFYGTTSITGTSFVGALSAYVENEGTTTVASSQILCGLDCYQIGTPANSGVNAAINLRGTWAKAFNFAGATFVDAHGVGSVDSGHQILIYVNGSAKALAYYAVGT